MRDSRKTLYRSKLISLEAVNFVLKPLHISIVSIIIIRQYNSELWGEFILFLLGIEMLLTFVNWGQKPFLIREFSRVPSLIGISWSKAFFSRIILLMFSLVLISISPFISGYKIIFSVWFISRCLTSFIEPIIQFNRKYKWSILTEVFSLGVSLGLLYLFSNDLDLGGLLLVFALSSLVKMLLIVPLVPSWKLPAMSLQKAMLALSISFPFFALSVSGLIQTKGDLYMVTALLDKVDIAKYQIIIGFLVLGQTISSIVLGPFQKNIYRFKENEIKGLKTSYLKIGWISTSILSLGLFLVLKLIYQFEFPILYLLLFVAYLMPMYFYLIESQFLIKNGFERKVLYYTIMAAIIDVVLCIALIPLFELTGALYSGILSRIILARLIVFSYKKMK